MYFITEKLRSPACPRWSMSPLNRKMFIAAEWDWETTPTALSPNCASPPRFAKSSHRRMRLQKRASATIATEPTLRISIWCCGLKKNYGVSARHCKTSLVECVDCSSTSRESQNIGCSYESALPVGLLELHT